MSAARALINVARVRVGETYTSRSARALDPEAVVDGVAVWHVRDGKEKVLTSLPMPHELHDVDDVSECADLAEAVAASHTSVDRTMSLFTSLGIAALVVIGADVIVGTISDVTDGRLSAPWLGLIKGATILVVVLVLVARVTRESDPPEVWERRGLAYRRRLVDLQTPAAMAPPCDYPVHNTPACRRWWRRRA